MRRLIGAVVLCALLVMTFSCLAEQGKGATFSSEKPRYARVALTEDGSKVLSVVFDESKGTGKGYDAIYADVGFSGKFDGAKKVTGKTEGRGGYFSCAFEPINLNVPYNQHATGVSNPCQIRFSYSRYPTGRNLTVIRLSRTKNPEPNYIENFGVTATVTLRQRTDVWEYSFGGPIQPSERSEKASVWGFKGPPTAAVDTRPDVNKKGNLGIALNLSSGGIPIEIKKAGISAKAHIEVKKPDGTAVHRDDVALDKLFFG